MKKLLAIILSITMLFSTATMAFADETTTKETIKVGINAEYAPFEYYNEDGVLTGFDIDLMNYIGERINYDIDYVEMSFDKLIPAIVNGEIDCAISAITITEERNNVIDYTVPYLSAKVTYFDGETSDASIEQYAVVFPNNSAEKGKLTEAAGEPEKSVYNLVNGALSDLIEDKTIEKLGEKYELNKAADTDDFDYEYTVMPVPDDFDKSNMDKSELLSGGQTSATSNPASEWALADIDKAQALNIVNAGGNYNFPEAITREKFCELAYNYIVEFGKDLVVINNHKFKDTDNEKIEALSSLGIINGKSETEFAPNDLLTREEAATILNRLINVVHPDLASTELYYEFADSAQISDWAMSDIQRICNMGIMKGVGNNNFAPQDYYTTEQAIVTLVRVYASSGVSKNIIDAEERKVSFYSINPDYNTLNEEIQKQEDGWYKLPDVVGSFINYDGEEPKSVTAYFTPTGINMEQYEKQVGFTELLWHQNPISVKLTFTDDDIMGHLYYLFTYNDGSTVKSKLFNVLVEH